MLTGLNSLRKSVLEHNSLNGLVFVTVEFFLIMFGALFIAWSGWIHGNIVLIIFGIGVAANALTVALMALHQRMNNEPDEGIMKVWSSTARQRIAAEHPNLGTRTLAIVISTIIPFMLVIAINLNQKRP